MKAQYSNHDFNGKVEKSSPDLTEREFNRE